MAASQLSSISLQTSTAPGEMPASSSSQSPPSGTHRVPEEVHQSDGSPEPYPSPSESRHHEVGAPTAASVSSQSSESATHPAAAAQRSIGTAASPRPSPSVSA